MIKRFSGLLVCIVLVLTSIFSCKKSEGELDISGVDVEVSLNRFHELFNSAEELKPKDWAAYKNENPTFFNAFSTGVLGLNSTDEDNFEEAEKFRAYFDSLDIITHVATEFNALPEYQEYIDLQKRLTVAFPTYRPISLTTMISGFNYKNLLLDDQIAVGLELYLGDEFNYTTLGTLINDYEYHRFSRNYILPDVTTAIIDDLYEDNGEFNTFLKRIIYEGRKLYAKEKLLPNVAKETLIGMTEEDYKWCLANEKMIWQYFVREELLYSNDVQRWKTYVFDGPFSAGMPEDAPSLTGNFIGWQIVTAYQRQQPNSSLEALMSVEDEISILQSAKYAP